METTSEMSTREDCRMVKNSEERASETVTLAHPFARKMRWGRPQARRSFLRQHDRAVEVLRRRLLQEVFAALAVERRELARAELAVQVVGAAEAVLEPAVAEGVDHDARELCESLLLFGR